MSDYTISVTRRVDPFALNMKDRWPEEMPSVWYVPSETADFATLTVGPITFYLNAAQIRRLAEMVVTADARLNA